MLAGLVLVVLLYPEQLTIVPAYHVTLTDQSGLPMAGTPVSELWQQTSVHRREILEQLATDAQGEVTLPARTVRSPLAERILGCLAYHSREGMTAPCGNRFSISAAGDLKELGRTETITGILKRQRSLVIKLERCDMREPELC
jgi:hypothetical protein